MTHADIPIRRARAEEAGAIARLFLISSDGLAAYIWGQMEMPGLSLEEVGAARYARRNTPFSFENCLVAANPDGVLGMAHAFAMPPREPGEVETDPVLRPYSELEDAGSLYVSGLAVLEPHRGRGIGRALMDRVEQHAGESGFPRVSLICFDRNTRALAFYRRRGYRETARRALVPHPSLKYDSGDAVLLVRDSPAAPAAA